MPVLEEAVSVFALSGVVAFCSAAVAAAAAAAAAAALLADGGRIFEGEVCPEDAVVGAGVADAAVGADVFAFASATVL